MTTEHRAAIFHDIDTERAVQDAKWGGPEHDDKHDIRDWTDFITDHAERASDCAPPGERRQMVRVAALAVAAIESMDRKAGNVPTCGGLGLYDMVTGESLSETGGQARDLATIISKCGDLGIRAIAAMANVSEDDVLRAIDAANATRYDHDRLVADANDQAAGRRRAGEGLRHILGLLGMPKDTPVVTVDDAERLASALLAELWVRRSQFDASTTPGVLARELVDGLRRILGLLGLPDDAPLITVDDAERTAAELLANRWVLRGDVERPDARAAITPPKGWIATSTGGPNGGADVLAGPGECRIRVEPWGFAVTDADGDEAAAGVAAIRCAMAIHERRYGGSTSSPSTVTLWAMTSADIERLVQFVYWLTASVGWLDVRSIINDSLEDVMTSPGAEALAREFVAELLRKNGDDHGRG